MRTSITLVGILVAAMAAAEEPGVEARLEEAAAAAAALERVLEARLPDSEPRCQGSDCRPGQMNRNREVREPRASNEAPNADDLTPSGGAVRGVGGMGKMGGMRGAKGAEGSASMDASVAPDGLLDTPIDRTAEGGGASDQIESVAGPGPGSETDPATP